MPIDTRKRGWCYFDGSDACATFEKHLSNIKNPLDGVISNDHSLCMNTMTVTDFKSHALKTINQVHTEHQMIVLTKWGSPIAELRPFQSKSDHPIPGKLSAALVSEEDIITPFGDEEWGAAQ